jgi:hypothetical protein
MSRPDKPSRRLTSTFPAVTVRPAKIKVFAKTRRRPHFRNMTLSYWIIGPRSSKLTTFLHLQGPGGLNFQTSRPFQTPATDYPVMRCHTAGREDVHVGLTLSSDTGTGRDTLITLQITPAVTKRTGPYHGTDRLIQPLCVTSIQGDVK